MLVCRKCYQLKPYEEFKYDFFDSRSKCKECRNESYLLHQICNPPKTEACPICGKYVRQEYVKNCKHRVLRKT